MNPTQIAVEAADRHLKWLYPNDKPKFGLERKHLITEIQSAIEKATEHLRQNLKDLAQVTNDMRKERDQLRAAQAEEEETSNEGNPQEYGDS